MKSFYNADVQVGAMNNFFPQFSALKSSNNYVEFRGELQVLPQLPLYTVTVLYKGELRPEVRILKPVIREDAPHIYPDDRTLCLYHPANFKWNRRKLIAKEIMHWTVLWIFFYEVWLQTGKWFGPEAEHKLKIK